MKTRKEWRMHMKMGSRRDEFGLFLYISGGSISKIEHSMLLGIHMMDKTSVLLWEDFF